MRIFYPEDVNAVDTNSKWLGIPPQLLMENAGKSVAENIAQEYPSSDFKNVVVVCGTGNNGGDGFVAARHLATQGYNVYVVLLGNSKLIRSEESKNNWKVLEKMFFSVKLLEIKDSSNLAKLSVLLEDADIVVDAILGVGSRGSPRGLYGEAIKLINKYAVEKKFKVVSIDIPSGLDVYEGKLYEPYINPDLVVTFIAPKNGLDKINAKIVVRQIGQPPESELLVGPGDARRILKPRPLDSHKGDFGRIMIIGGSKDYYGAPALSGLAALRTGADLVFIFTPEPTAETIKKFSPDLIVRTLKGDYLRENHIEQLLSFAEKVDVVIVGPGLGLEEETLTSAYKLVESLLDLGKKVIVDADGLKALAKYGLPGNSDNDHLVITPHAGEFKLIFDVTPPKNWHERGELVKEKALSGKCTIVLKGNIDTISNGRVVKFNVTGNPGMTVGGTGDVLTGIIGALFALTENALLAASVGAFISGLAGDIAFKRKGYSLTATDVVDSIPEALLNI